VPRRYGTMRRERAGARPGPEMKTSKQPTACGQQVISYGRRPYQVPAGQAGGVRREKRLSLTTNFRSERQRKAPGMGRTIQLAQIEL